MTAFDFPHCKDSSFIRGLVILENMDSPSKSYAEAVKGQASNTWWRRYQEEDEEEPVLIAMEKSRAIVKVTVVLVVWPRRALF